MTIVYVYVNTLAYISIHASLSCEKMTYISVDAGDAGYT